MPLRLLSIAIFLAACSGTGAVTSTLPDGSTTNPSQTSPTTSGPGVETTTSVPIVIDPTLAPDFTLELGDGGSFTLSETNRPVYLIFWAEWCPVCRKELPIVDKVAAEYGDRVEFVAPVWKSGEEATRQIASDLFHSGKIQWGLDPDQVIFSLYGVPYQPVTVLISADRKVVEEWAGVRSEQGIRESLDALIAASEGQDS